jgi:Tfp pilus assembly protein PilN
MINPSDPTSFKKDESLDNEVDGIKNTEDKSEPEYRNLDQKVENKNSKTFLDFIKKVENKEVKDVNELNEDTEENKKINRNEDTEENKKINRNEDTEENKKEAEEIEESEIINNKIDRIEINLIPDNISTIPVQINKMIKSGFIFGLSMTITFLIYLGIYVYGKSSEKKVEDIRAENSKLEQQYASYKKSLEDIKTTKINLDEIIKLLDNHIYWTKFFNLLEENTIPEVFYYNFTGDTSGQITLNAITDSYLNVSRQMIAFKNATNFVDSISVNNASANKLKVKKEETSNNEIQEEGSEDKIETEEQSVIAFNVFLDLKDDVFLKTEDVDNLEIVENLSSDEEAEEAEEVLIEENNENELNIQNKESEETEAEEVSQYDLSDEEINELLEEESLDKIASQIENELNIQKED